MKTKTINIIKLSLVVSLFALVSTVNAQESNMGNSYFSGDWQFNSPVANDFNETASGWGANLEFLRFITPNLSAGVFVAWHTNNEYIPRSTYTQGATSINTDAVNSLFQLPFGVSGRYALLDGNIVPYAGLKIGAMYSEQYAYFNTITLSASNWGFYVSPEIGLTFYPMQDHLFGINVSAYYGYATNKNEDFNINGLNNAGFRIGVLVRL